MIVDSLATEITRLLYGEMYILIYLLVRKKRESTPRSFCSFSYTTDRYECNNIMMQFLARLEHIIPRLMSLRYEGCIQVNYFK